MEGLKIMQLISIEWKNDVIIYIYICYAIRFDLHMICISFNDYILSCVIMTYTIIYCVFIIF